ncbi:oxygenase MpaB family protein [Caulobacter sp. RL271]|uniref:Oxygenase MpaB family protein n=1 Tax=Caulobacter segnis TaxID=88688 RepID=A0ABY4ZX75_9CAUL|nr:oxygenase MpaB family protein [Caulobacter segnis]USQ97151.1 oxygenase MpaB family protein [Caulobacter segnis]
MPTPLERVRAKVAAQKTALPALYGDVDFDATPERFTDDPKASVAPHLARKGGLDPDKVALIKAYTMLGDVVADAYAALMPKYGFRPLIQMLTTACDAGIEAVPDAPPELAAFIADMERAPDWVDMDLVREGQRLDRNAAANLGPFAIRGAFIATFMNKYAALPMALTGTLSNDTAARRVNETATFFTTTLLPGSLERHGAGFRAAAMVRLMHSMVRFNALKRSDRWDVRVYGIPIPQVDQMPAGLIPIFLMSYKIVAQGRKTFTADERARVELARYRCFLLGLPEDLLADTPQGVVDTMNARSGTLRAGFDDATCGELVRATLNAYLPPDERPENRLFDKVERRFSKVFFLRNFMNGDLAAARRMGVEIGPRDFMMFGLVALLVTSQLMAYRFARNVPGVSDLADAHLVAKLKRQLKRYGHAEFTSDAEKYRPAGTAKPAAA